MGTCSCSCMSEKPEKTDEIAQDPKKIVEQLDKSVQADPSPLTVQLIPNKLNAEAPSQSKVTEITPESILIFSSPQPITYLQALIRGHLSRKSLKNSQEPQPQALIEVPKTISTMEARQAYSRLPPFKFDKVQGDEPVDWKGPTRLLDGSVYVGEWGSKGLPHGKGIMYYIDGGICEGYWKDGKLHGGGRRISPRGDVYTGSWINGKMHGQGIMEYASKSTYTGFWLDDKQHGTGTEVWPDGSKFEGSYTNGLKSGKGKFFWADETKYEGEFSNDVIEGFGKYTWSNKEYEGTWKNSKMHGKGIFRWSDGKIYEGEYENDTKSGHGVLKWPDGRKYEGSWKNGKFNGEGILYQRGKQRKGVWEDGEFKKRLR